MHSGLEDELVPPLSVAVYTASQRLGAWLQQMARVVHMLCLICFTGQGKREYLGLFFLPIASACKRNDSVP